MKKQNNTLFNNLSTEQFAKLTSVVTEKLALEFKTEKSRTFTSADLWSIQRQAKTVPSRRFQF